MGWFTQGYLKQLDYSTSPPKIKNYKWVVGNNGQENHKINAYNHREVGLNTDHAQLEIHYGPSNNKYFRGYFFSTAPIAPSKILRSFDGFPVYKYKHGNQEKIFNSKGLIVERKENLTLFYELRPIWSEQEWGDLKTEFLNMTEYTTFNSAVIELLSELKPKYW